MKERSETISGRCLKECSDTGFLELFQVFPESLNFFPVILKVFSESLNFFPVILKVFSEFLTVMHVFQLINWRLPHF